MPSDRLRRRRLPHWDVPGATYFITACLAGSIPSEGLIDIAAYRKSLEAQRPKHITRKAWARRCSKLHFARTDEWLDGSYCRHFDDQRLARIAADAIRYFEGHRYTTFAFVIMPSHVHWLVQPAAKWSATLPPSRSPRESLLHTFKTHTAIECNRMLSTGGRFWQDEAYDHVVRSDEELARIADYIENNPVKAGLCGSPTEWRFSSAFERFEGLRDDFPS